MAISKKSITKPSASKSTKAPKSIKSPTAPAGKMETTMRMAKVTPAKLARPVVC